MSNWYAAHISDKKFDRMDTKKQEKILEHIKDYNETTLDKKAESKAEQILNSSENHYANVDEYMANTNRIENFRDDLDIDKNDENKIKELEAKIDELTKRNEEILEQENQEKKQIALVENGKLIEYYEEDNETKRREGNIYIGIVKDIIKGMQFVFFLDFLVLITLSYLPSFLCFNCIYS